MPFCDFDWQQLRTCTEYGIFFRKFIEFLEDEETKYDLYSLGRAEYGVVASTCCELYKPYLSTVRNCTLHHDHQVVLNIGAHLIFHKRTKHIEMNCHFYHRRDSISFLYLYLYIVVLV